MEERNQALFQSTRPFFVFMGAAAALIIGSSVAGPALALPLIGIISAQMIGGVVGGILYDVVVSYFSENSWGLVKNLEDISSAPVTNLIDIFVTVICDAFFYSADNKLLKDFVHLCLGMLDKAEFVTILGKSVLKNMVLKLPYTKFINLIKSTFKAKCFTDWLELCQGFLATHKSICESEWTPGIVKTCLFCP